MCRSDNPTPLIDQHQQSWPLTNMFLVAQSLDKDILREALLGTHSRPQGRWDLG